MRLHLARLKRTLLLVLPAAAGLLVTPLMLSHRHAPAPGPSAEAPRTAPGERARETYGRIPLSFEANRGQADGSVDFLARGAGYALFLKPTEAVFVLRNEDRVDKHSLRTGARTPAASPQPATRNPQSKVLRMKVVGADASAAAVGENELAGKANYLVGDDPSKWRTDLPTYAGVRYPEVYPGVDLIYYGNQRQLEYDFHIAPGRDPHTVSLKFEGADKIEVDERGDLLLKLGESVVRQPKPFVYQEVAGARREVEGGYAVGTDGRVGFSVGEYDAGLPLVIDPTLVYSTYLGGSGGDQAWGVAVDSAGQAFLAGFTTSTNFPTSNALQAANAGFQDAFVAKLNAAGTAFVYSTYLGGSGNDQARAIAVDSAGSAYVTGFTGSTNFPTANALQASQGAGNNQDVFVSKLNATGSALAYSTYLGGDGALEFGEGIAVDSAGNAYVAGVTNSTNFPTANAIQAAHAGSGDVFVTKFNASGSALAYSTYLGGTAFDLAEGVTVDSAGNAYITGGSGSNTTFPTANAIQCARAGGTDVIVTKINAAGTALAYSTYLGGSGSGTTIEIGRGIAVDSAGNAYVAGGTDSTDFPTANPIQSAYAGSDFGLAGDAFALKLSDATAGPASPLQFTAMTTAVQEDMTFVTLTVQRTGDTSTAVTVDYATADVSASERSDYTTAVGTLRFAAGDTSESFDVLVNEDSFAEGSESFTVSLSNPTGGATLSCLTAVATVNITDDASEPAANVLDDATVFVGQHYHDFLNRRADPGGLGFWAGQITACGSDAACIDRARANVSAAFFLSIEFQQTGYLVFRFYKASFTDSAARPRGMPRYREFLRDTQEVGRGVVVNQGDWQTQLEANKQEFARRWVQRPEFLAQFPESMSAGAFVDKLFQNSEVTPTQAERDAAVAAYGAGGVEGRAAALRSVADSGSVYNRQFNAGFVLSQYIGYLRRNPNDAPEPGLNYAGYDFWLAKLDSFSRPGEDVRNEQTALARVNRAEMVRAFIVSAEYRGRFGQP